MRVSSRELLVKTQNSNNSDGSLNIYEMVSMLNALAILSHFFSHNKLLKCGHYYTSTD